MSDLQCPATVLLLPAESLASIEAATAFAGRRLSGFFVEAAFASDAAATALARAAGCNVDELAALADAASLERAVEGLADLYRGETVALVASAAVIQARLDCSSPPTSAVEIAIDSSGWKVRQAGEHGCAQ